MVGRQNADITDTLHLRDVAMATTFCLSMGYKFGCVIASSTIFDSRVFRVKLSDEVIANFEVRRDVAMATILAFYIWGAHWCHLANTTEPFMCGGDTAFCEITLTTCYTLLRRKAAINKNIQTFTMLRMMTTVYYFTDRSGSLRGKTLSAVSASTQQGRIRQSLCHPLHGCCNNEMSNLNKIMLLPLLLLPIGPVMPSNTLVYYNDTGQSLCSLQL